MNSYFLFIYLFIIHILFFLWFFYFIIFCFKTKPNQTKPNQTKCPTELWNPIAVDHPQNLLHLVEKLSARRLLVHFPPFAIQCYLQGEYPYPSIKQQIQCTKNPKVAGNRDEPEEINLYLYSWWTCSFLTQLNQKILFAHFIYS